MNFCLEALLCLLGLAACSHDLEPAKQPTQQNPPAPLTQPSQPTPSMQPAEWQPMRRLRSAEANNASERSATDPKQIRQAAMADDLLSVPADGLSPLKPAP
jgi:hypothetical protein